MIILLICLLIGILIYHMSVVIIDGVVSPNRSNIKKLQDPVGSGQLYVSPFNEGNTVSDFDFVSHCGKLTYLQMFIDDPYVMSTTEQAREMRPTEGIDCFVTLSVNGVPFLHSMPIQHFPAFTNIDLSSAITTLPELNAMDVISLSLKGGDEIYRGVGVGYGIC